MVRSAGSLLQLLTLSHLSYGSALHISTPRHPVERGHATTRRASATSLVWALAATLAASAAAEDLPSVSVPSVVYKDNAAEGDIGTRPAVFGVPAGALYFAFAGSVQLSIALKGQQGTMMKNGTIYRNGKLVAQPFKFSADDAASAASAARLASTNSSKKR